MPSLSRLRFALLAVAAVLAVAGCRVDTEVLVRVDEDGSGRVEVGVGLDEVALGHVPDLSEGDGVEDLTALLRTGDLEEAGWLVEPPEPAGDMTWVRISRPFGTPEEGEAVLAELSGGDGALSGFQIDRSTSFGVDSFELAGVADLSGGLESFTDAALADALEGEPLGEDEAALEDRFGQPVAEMFRLDLQVQLPGGVQESWEPELGGEPVPVEASTTRYDVPALVLAGAAVVCVLALISVLLLRAVRRT